MSAKKSIWTPANVVTCARVVLVPLWLLVAELVGVPSGETLSWSAMGVFAFFLLISLTDKVDGYLARSRNEVTTFGKFLDPIADKMLVTSAMLVFTAWHWMPAWVVIVVIAREFMVSALRLVAATNGRVIAAGWSGKVKTASTMVCICLMLFGIPHWLNLVCQGVILATTVYSGVEYFAKNWDVFQEKK